MLGGQNVLPSPIPLKGGSNRRWPRRAHNTDARSRHGRARVGSGSCGSPPRAMERRRHATPRRLRLREITTGRSLRRRRVDLAIVNEGTGLLVHEEIVLRDLLHRARRDAQLVEPIRPLGQDVVGGLQPHLVRKEPRRGQLLAGEANREAQRLWHVHRVVRIADGLEDEVRDLFHRVRLGPSEVVRLPGCGRVRERAEDGVRNVIHVHGLLLGDAAIGERVEGEMARDNGNTVQELVLIAKERRWTEDGRRGERLFDSRLADGLSASPCGRRIKRSSHRRDVDHPVHALLRAHLGQHGREAHIDVVVRPAPRLRLPSQQVDHHVATTHRRLNVVQGPDRRLLEVDHAEVAHGLQVTQSELVATIGADDAHAHRA
mmetsp:Transcript_38240/g.81525  ORF Transcript_38240/g.81525 Transcript_38240/m.81525 type:complete len:374 (+) Transcript_38240:332-1453(+)